MFQAMGDNAQSAMFEILKRIQTDVSDINVRLERVEKLVKKQRRDSAAMLVMMRATAGDFEERISDLEDEMKRRGE